MQNESHYISDENLIPESDIKKLPDRSNLSKLYYQTEKGYQKGSVNYRKLSNESSETSYTKKLYAVFIPIGVAIPGLIAFAILAYAFFSSQMKNKYDVMFNLPFLASTGIAFALAIYGIFNKINEKLYALGVSITKFFLLSVCFLILAYEPAFLLFSRIDNELFSFIMIISAFSGFSIIYTWLLLKGLSDDRISPIKRNIMIFVPLVICFFITMFTSLAIISL